jgi:hypothetical protein
MSELQVAEGQVQWRPAQVLKLRRACNVVRVPNRTERSPESVRFLALQLFVGDLIFSRATTRNQEMIALLRELQPQVSESEQTRIHNFLKTVCMLEKAHHNIADWR